MNSTKYISIYRKWDQVLGEENMFSMTGITRENKNYALYENEFFYSIKLVRFLFCITHLLVHHFGFICFYVSIFRRILFCFLKGRPLNMSKITQK